MIFPKVARCRVFGATGDKPLRKHRTSAPLLCGKFFTLVEIPALSQKLILWPKIANSTILGHLDLSENSEPKIRWDVKKSP